MSAHFCSVMHKDYFAPFEESFFGHCALQSSFLFAVLCLALCGALILLFGHCESSFFEVFFCCWLAQLLNQKLSFLLPT